jgi:hypothetical protein
MAGAVGSDGQFVAKQCAFCGSWVFNRPGNQKGKETRRRTVALSLCRPLANQRRVAHSLDKHLAHYVGEISVRILAESREEADCWRTMRHGVLGTTSIHADKDLLCRIMQSARENLRLSERHKCGGAVLLEQYYSSSVDVRKTRFTRFQADVMTRDRSILIIELFSVFRYQAHPHWR